MFKRKTKTMANERVIEILEAHMAELADELQELDPSSGDYGDAIELLEWMNEEKAKFVQTEPERKPFTVKIGGEVLTALIGAGVAIWSTNKVLKYQEDDNILDSTQTAVVKGLITNKK